MQKPERFWRQFRRTERKLVVDRLEHIPHDVRGAIFALLFDPTLADKRTGELKVTTAATPDDWNRRSEQVLNAVRQIAEYELDGDPEKVTAAERDAKLEEAVNLLRERVEGILYPAKKINNQRAETRSRIDDLTRTERENTATVTGRYDNAAVIAGLETAVLNAETEFNAHPTPQNHTKLKKAREDLDHMKQMQKYARTRQSAESQVTRAQAELARIRQFNTDIVTDPAACLGRLAGELTTATTEYDAKRIDYEADRNNRTKKIAFEAAKTELEFCRKLHQMAVDHDQGLKEDYQKRVAQHFINRSFLPNHPSGQARLSNILTGIQARLTQARTDYAGHRTEANRLALAEATSNSNLWRTVRDKTDEFVQAHAASDQYGRLVSEFPGFITNIQANPANMVTTLTGEITTATSGGERHRVRILQQLLTLCREFGAASGAIVGHLPANKKRRSEIIQKMDELFIQIQEENDRRQEAFRRIDREFRSPDFLTGTPSSKVLTPGRLTDLEQEYQEKTVAAVDTAQEADKLTDMIADFNNRLTQLTQEAGEKLTDNSNGRDLAFRAKYLRSHKGNPAPPTTQPEALAEAQRQEGQPAWVKVWDDLKSNLGFDTLIMQPAQFIGQQIGNLINKPRKKIRKVKNTTHVRAGAARPGQVRVFRSTPPVKKKAA